MRNSQQHEEGSPEGLTPNRVRSSNVGVRTRLGSYMLFLVSLLSSAMENASCLSSHIPISEKLTVAPWIWFLPEDRQNAGAGDKGKAVLPTVGSTNIDWVKRVHSVYWAQLGPCLMQRVWQGGHEDMAGHTDAACCNATLPGPIALANSFAS